MPLVLVRFLNLIDLRFTEPLHSKKYKLNNLLAVEGVAAVKPVPLTVKAIF